jgi:acetyl/propionyl-CoA carboxylase alpha subunit
VAERLIRRVVVPNRGEIAVRIARACREAGIESVLAHSASDDVRFVQRFFDRTVSLGDGDARATYLDVGKIIDAARRSEADALHPGYGFLSERAELAAACQSAGISFIGPTAASIEAMGSKAEARRLMKRLGVPVVPGYDGEDQSDEILAGEAERIGFPLLVKASAGGGGKGMKIVRVSSELRPALESARREATKAFGNDRLLVERYLQRPRHVEFQIFGDEEGHLVHLFERDCSIQRRHQKVIEESPAPRYPEDLRQRMGNAAVRAAEGVGYRSAGTVEFIVTPDGEFYFLEMNTRLQVEHPVTELVLGVDLVRAQLDVAGGKALPWSQGDLRQRGHAIEARVYAEDPDDRFLPQSGTIESWCEPSGPGIRVDAGVAAGSVVHVNFDPMLAKVIAWGDSRDAAIARLARALGEMTLLGIRSNIGYLRRIILHPAFGAGEVSTSFIPEHEDDLRRVVPGEAFAVAAALSQLAAKPGFSRANDRAAAVTVWDRVGTWGR